MHLGEHGRAERVWHNNSVDESSHYHHVGTVESISEYFLLPALERLLQAFPFAVEGFPTQNGS